jgi:hypothetical protein
MERREVAMLPEEKRAVFVLVVIGCSVAAVAVLVPFIGRGAWGGLGFLGLIGLTQWLFRKGEPKADERDVAISHRAGLIAGAASYLAFFLACFCPLMYCLAVGVKTISSMYLGLVIVIGAVAPMAVRSIAVLALYRQGGDHAED